MGLAETKYKPKGNPNWVKGGASPNPAGRQKSSWTLAKMTAGFLDEPDPDDELGTKRGEKILASLYDMALGGGPNAVPAAKELLLRCIGPVVQPVVVRIESDGYTGTIDDAPDSVIIEAAMQAGVARSLAEINAESGDESPG